jgi:Fe-S-cluster-containing dehydrogenase component
MKQENENEKTLDEAVDKSLSRRGFLKIVGVFTIGAASSGILGCDETTDDPSMYPSMGYILVDSRKCQGCLTCMISCSLVNEGSVCLSLSRLQVRYDHFDIYPDNLTITQCRQCEDPKCVKACPNDALVIDKDNGNIRVVKTAYCVGCGRCIMGCPHKPERPMVTQDPRYGGRMKSRKCELCLNAPYHFAHEGGGVEGVRTCESVCPVGAIKFTTKLPVQDGDKGYEVNLRDSKWKQLGYDVKL